MSERPNVRTLLSTIVLLLSLEPVGDEDTEIRALLKRVFLWLRVRRESRNTCDSMRMRVFRLCDNTILFQPTTSIRGCVHTYQSVGMYAAIQAGREAK